MWDVVKKSYKEKTSYLYLYRKHSERNIHMFWKLQTRGIYGGDQEGYFLEGKKEPESQ